MRKPAKPSYHNTFIEVQVAQGVVGPQSVTFRVSEPLTIRVAHFGHFL